MRMKLFHFQTFCWPKNSRNFNFFAVVSKETYFLNLVLRIDGFPCSLKFWLSVLNKCCFFRQLENSVGFNLSGETNIIIITAQKMKFSNKDFFSKCDHIRSFLRMWSHLLQKSLMWNFIFCAVNEYVSHFQIVEEIFITVSSNL